MPFTLTMPKLSPTMKEGTIVKWHKKIGEYVEAGDVLMEVATDKATVEHNALDSGWLKKIIVSEGQEAIVNQAIAIFTESKDESIEGYQPEGVSVSQASPAASKQEGGQEAAPAVEEASEKLPKAKSAAIPLAAFAPEAPLENYAFEYPSEVQAKRIAASPLAKKLAKEKKLDLSTLKGSGPRGRILQKDLEKAQGTGKFAFGRRAVPSIAPGTFEEETLTPMRKVIGQRLQEAKMFIPHFYIQHEIDAQPLIDVREQLKKHEIGVTFNDLIVKACAIALKEHPVVNSGFNTVNNTIVRFKTIDIAVAVSVPDGLITPIIRHTNFKNLGEIALEVRNLIKRAKDGKLEMHEYKGGSFTISNLGMFGIQNFQAIINPPQAAILAVGGIFEKPVVKNSQIIPGKVMSMTLSLDHRVVDGAAGAAFLKTLQNLLENPAVLLLP